MKTKIHFAAKFSLLILLVFSVPFLSVKGKGNGNGKGKGNGNGSITIIEELVSKDDYKIENGKTLVIASSGHLIVNGTFSNMGTLTIKNGGILELNGSFYELKKDATNVDEGGTILLNGSVDVHYKTGNISSFDFTSDVVINNTGVTFPASGTTISGDLTLNAGADLTGVNISGSITIADTVDISNLDWLTKNGYNLNFNNLIVKSNKSVQLSGSTTVVNVLIEPNGTLEVASTARLLISGNFRNEGRLSDLGGGVEFISSNEQELIGSGDYEFNFQNMFISNTHDNGLKINAQVNIHNYIKLNQNAYLNIASGSVQLISTSSDGYAEIKKLENGAKISGSITYEKTIDYAQGYRHYGSSLQHVDMNQWDASFNIKVSGWWPTIYKWDETKATNAGQGAKGWIKIGSAEENVTPGRGYTIRFADADFNGDNKLRISETGAPVVGDGKDNIVSSGETFKFPNLTFTSTGFDGGGWNFVSNPYPATLDWYKESGWEKQNINGAIYKYDAVSGVYIPSDKYEGGGLIAPGQAFWVIANNASPSLSLNEDAKTDNKTSLLRTKIDYPRLEIKFTDQKDRTDKSILRILEGSTSQFDQENDALKLNGDYVNISTYGSDKTMLSINSLKPGLLSENVYLNVSSSLKGSHTFNFNKSNFDSHQILLKDHYLNQTINLDTTSTYAFEITSDPATFGTERFELVLAQQVDFFINQQEVYTNKLVEVPVLVKHFNNILTSQLGMTWNQELLQLQDITNFGLASMNTSSFNLTQPGQLKLAWDQPDLTPQNLNDNDTLFALVFKVVGQEEETTKVQFNQDIITTEIVGEGLQTLAALFTDGEMMIKPMKSISGRVMQVNDKAVAATLNMRGDSQLSADTDQDGYFRFEVPVQDQVTLQVANQATPDSKGISTLDILLARRHILGQETMDNPFMIAAADVNGSGTVTTLDIALIRQVILGLGYQFAGQQSIKYVSALNYQEQVEATNPDQSYDFVEIKLGDLNNSWKNDNQRISQSIDLALESVEIQEETEITIPIRISQDLNLTGYQFTLNYDAQALEFVSAGNSQNDIHVNQELGQGTLAVQWDDASGKGQAFKNGDAIMELTFKVHGMAGQVAALNINSDHTTAILLDQHLNEYNINSQNIEFEIAEQAQVMGHEGFSTYPNPVTDYATVSFMTEQQGPVVISIINTLGKVVDRIEQEYLPGSHQLEWSAQGKEKGMYLMNLQVNGKNYTKKLIIR
ncbi:MAG: cohesin domain-containing protein [Candidatus Cyclobacteriaceae bacterium M3_2C_046]